MAASSGSAAARPSAPAATRSAAGRGPGHRASHRGRRGTPPSAARRARRRPGRPRGRHDAGRLDLGGRGPQAAARPGRRARPRARRGAPRGDRGALVPARQRAPAPPDPALADRPRRRRAGRVAVHRLQGAGHQRQRPAAGGRAGHRQDDVGWHRRPGRRARRRAVLPPAGRPDEPHQGRPAGQPGLRDRREARAHHDLPRLPLAHQPDEGPPARLPVPRRRAQDDLVLRGRARADARERAALHAPAPALRDELPAHRDDRRDRGLRPAGHARLVLALPLADPRDPDRGRPGLRGHQALRPLPPAPVGPGHDVARDAAAAPHDARARPRAARRGDRRDGRRARGRAPGETAPEELVGLEVVA